MGQADGACLCRPAVEGCGGGPRHLGRSTELARALLAHFNLEEVGKLLGGNYARVFAASVA
jgi:hypothetical protein